MDERLERLRREAEFQNRRTLEGAEPRDRFYWVIEQAYADLDKAVAAHSGQRVLVVGCAEGNVTPLARRGVRVVGVDISDQAVARLRETIAREGLGDRAEVHVMDAEELAGFGDASFDAVLASGVLHHLDVERACRAWRRVLKPSGELLMVEPLAWSPPVALYRWLTPGMRTPDEHPLVPADFRRLRSHFGRVEMRPYGLVSLASLAFNYLPVGAGPRARALRLLNAVDRGIFRWLPPARHLAWTAFIRCREPRP